MYCVRTIILRSPLLMQFDRAKSMMRYCPPKGTAGLARSAKEAERLVAQGGVGQDRGPLRLEEAVELAAQSIERVHGQVLNALKTRVGLV